MLPLHCPGKVLPVVLLGLALAIVCISDYRPARVPAAAGCSVLRLPTAVVPRPPRALLAAPTRLRRRCEAAGADVILPKRTPSSATALRNNKGSSTARGAVPETLELSSSVTTALEACLAYAYQAYLSD